MPDSTDQHVHRVVTEDGSWTLHDFVRDVTYRSTHGARTESRHVFVEPAGQRATSILELGFGGAMNFVETARVREGPLEYVAIEMSPMEPELIEHGIPAVDSLVRRALEQPGARVVESAMALTVHACRWQRADVSGRFDVIYHDPFAPDDDPECWTEECFAWHADHAHDDTLLATYSAAGHARRAMAAAGWWVARRPGPGRKREVTLAARQPGRLSAHDIAYEP